MHKDLVRIDILSLRFRKAAHRADKAVADRLQGDHSEGLMGFAVSAVQRIIRVLYQISPLGKVMNDLSHLFFRCCRSDLCRSTAEVLTVLDGTIHFQSNIFDLFSPVLIQFMPDEVEFPTTFTKIGNLPCGKSCFSQKLFQQTNIHQPNLALAFRYGPPSATLTHSL